MRDLRRILELRFENHSQREIARMNITDGQAHPIRRNKSS